MGKKFRVGIVGCGGVAENHLRGYIESGLAVVSVLHDSNPLAAAGLARRVGAEVVGSVAELAQRVDAASVCTPPRTHLEICRQLLRAGIPVLCEKPFEVELRRAMQLCAEAETTGTPLMPGFTQRFHPPLRKARQLVESGRLGAPVFLRSSFGARMQLRGGFRTDPKASGGGCLSDTASHSADLFRWFMGEAVAVSAQIHSFDSDLAVEDFGMVHIEGMGGRCGILAATSHLPVFPNDLELVCEKAVLRVNFYQPGVPELSVQWKIGAAPRKVQVPDSTYKFTAQAREFLCALRAGRAPSPAPRDGLESVRIISAAYAAAAGPRTVRLHRQAAAH